MFMKGLTTHILDLAKGRPAANVRIDVFEADGASIRYIRSCTTNRDGRPDDPLIEGSALHEGTYELHVHIGDYFKNSGNGPNSFFLDVIPVRFSIADGYEGCHVPLLVSPFGYQIYRGS